MTARSRRRTRGQTGSTASSPAPDPAHPALGLCSAQFLNFTVPRHMERALQVATLAGRRLATESYVAWVAASAAAAVAPASGVAAGVLALGARFALKGCLHRSAQRTACPDNSSNCSGGGSTSSTPSTESSEHGLPALARPSAPERARRLPPLSAQPRRERRTRRPSSAAPPVGEGGAGTVPTARRELSPPCCAARQGHQLLNVPNACHLFRRSHQGQRDQEGPEISSRQGFQRWLARKRPVSTDSLACADEDEWTRRHCLACHILSTAFGLQ